MEGSKNYRKIARWREKAERGGRARAGRSPRPYNRGVLENYFSSQGRHSARLEKYQARSQSGALGARAPPAILVHSLALLSVPPIGIEDSKVKDTVKF